SSSLACRTFIRGNASLSGQFRWPPAPPTLPAALLHLHEPSYRGEEMAQETATFFEELSALDAFFLYAERDEAPLHIGAVYVFDGGGGRGARGIALTLEERLHLV